jgi:signal transduction histidine kinase
VPESSSQGRISVTHPSSLNTFGELAAGIAHEIKTPTQYVSDNVRFLQEAFVDVLDLLAEYRRVAEANSPELALELRAADDKVDVGQGLHIARQIIEAQHDGRLWFETELNVGTCFAFWPPIKASNAS